MITGIHPVSMFKRCSSKARILFIAVFMMLPANFTSALAHDVGLIEPRALARNPAAWVVLDTRPKSEWQAGHIPGARSFSWEDYTGTDGKGIPYKVRPPREMAEALGAMGIDEKTPVTVYGDADKSWGGEGWAVWMLAWLGHKGPIRLLNGGIQAWRAGGLPLQNGDEKYSGRSARYRYVLQTQTDVSTAELQRLLGSVTIIDTRSTLEWLRGRIPTAVHIPGTISTPARIITRSLRSN
jgi:thiosulfate/3-mercaptopyruvate sulfurtransferase